MTLRKIFTKKLYWPLVQNLKGENAADEMKKLAKDLYAQIVKWLHQNHADLIARNNHEARCKNQLSQQRTLLIKIKTVEI